MRVDEGGPSRAISEGCSLEGCGWKSGRNVTYLLAFGLIPFLQIGAGFYASGFIVLALLVLTKWSNELLASMVQHPIRTLLCMLAFIMPMNYPAGVDGQDVQRALREVVVLTLMIAGFGVVGEKLSERSVKIYTRTIYLLIVFYFCLSLVQILFLSRQIYFGIPKEFFVVNEGTLPGELDLIYSKIRPTGTFGEPSYMGFILTSIAFALFPLAEKWILPRIFIILVAVLALICQSLSFFIAISLLIAFDRPGLKKIGASVIVVGMISASVLGIIFYDVLESFISRIMTISDQSAELSGYVRIFGPLSIIADYLSLYPTGTPFYKLYFVLEEYVPEGIRPLSYHDNGLMNFLFDFGFYGFILLFLYFSSVKNGVSRIYLFACGIFNGALLAPDKLAVMLFTFSLYNSFLMFARTHEPADHAKSNLAHGETKKWRPGRLSLLQRRHRQTRTELS
jgi:hypothetical protein